MIRCTPCRQRRGKDHIPRALGGNVRCTPCRQRRGKAEQMLLAAIGRTDAPRAGSAEAKLPCKAWRGTAEDAPRAGSAEAKPGRRLLPHRAGRMHPVQAAPRQRRPMSRPTPTSTDAPRAGSAQRNNNVPPDGSLTTGRHFFTFHPSRIPTVAPSSSVTMYNPVPHLLDRSSMAKQNLSHRANVICDGAPPRISPAAVV